MSDDLTNQYIDETFVSLLHLPNYSAGLTTSYQYVFDGNGDYCPLKLSTLGIIVGDVEYKDSYGTFNLIAAPTTPGVGQLRVYAKNKKLYIKDSDGLETDLTTSGSALSSTDDLPEGATNLYFTNERVDDRAAALIQNGTGITWSYNDGAGTLTPTVTITQYTDEMAQDTVATMIQNGTGITWSYNDGANTLTPTVTITQYTDEMAQDATGAMATNSTFVNLTYNDGANTLTPSLSATGTPDNTKFLRGDNTWAAPSGATLADADYGDITVSGGGTVMTIDNDVVTYAKMQNVSAQYKILGRSTAGAGDVEELATSANMVSLIASADYATARSNLGLAIGTNVQAYDATLTSIAALGTAADKIAYTTNIDTWAEASLTAAARSILDDASTSAINTTLGLGTGDSPQFTAVNIGHASDTTITRTGAGDIAVEGNAIYRAGGTDVALADGGTGASLTDPNADRIYFWDDSAGATDWLAPTNGIAITTTNISLDITGLTRDTAPDVTADYVPTYDASAATNKKVLLQDLMTIFNANAYPIMISQFSN